MQQRKGGIVFAVLVGLVVAVLSYRWAVDTRPREERLRQEQVVLLTRDALVETVGSGALEIVDPLAPDRKVGKVYIYPFADGWEVSGYYRRDDNDLWHPYMMRVGQDMKPVGLRLSDQDPTLVEKGKHDAMLEVFP